MSGRDCPGKSLLVICLFYGYLYGIPLYIVPRLKFEERMFAVVDIMIMAYQSNVV